jgi:hypothetical protein
MHVLKIIWAKTLTFLSLFVVLYIFLEVLSALLWITRLTSGTLIELATINFLISIVAAFIGTVRGLGRPFKVIKRQRTPEPPQTPG